MLYFAAGYKMSLYSTVITLLRENFDDVAMFNVLSQSESSQTKILTYETRAS